VFRLHIHATYITTFLDRDNVTPGAIASAGALFKSTGTHKGTMHPGASLGLPPDTPSLFITRHVIIYCITLRRVVSLVRY